MSGWAKGTSGNPGGRPKGLEKRVRELLAGDIDQMTLALRDIVLGTSPTEGPLKGAKITTRDRIEAYKALTDRGWGKPRQQLDVFEFGGETSDLSKLTADELEQLIHEAEDAEEAPSIPAERPAAEDDEEPPGETSS